MTGTARVYINARPVDVPMPASAIEAVAVWDAEEARAVKSGERMITDSRGLPIAPDCPVHNGAIFRIVRARQTASDDFEINQP